MEKLKGLLRQTGFGRRWRWRGWHAPFQYLLQALDLGTVELQQMSACGVQPLGAILLTQPQQRLRFAQVAQRVVGKNGSHHPRYILAKLCRFRFAVGRVEEQERLRWRR